MQSFWLICRSAGELYLVDAETAERAPAIEFDYLAKTIASDGFFENGGWRVREFQPAVPVEDR